MNVCGWGVTLTDSSKHFPRTAVLAYLVAALSPNMDVANAALPAYVVTLLFFVSQQESVLLDGRFVY